MEDPRALPPVPPQHYRPAPPHRVRLPDPTVLSDKLDPGDKAFFTELVAALQREMDLRIQRDVAQKEFLIFAPGGHVFAIRCANNGVLSAQLISSPPS